ncbi:MAG TPA: hypothetical protein VH253_04055 [Phycisphaerae bacterium]|nr:hypothetical protein [Phycisphaerae bacterium]
MAKRNPSRTAYLSHMSLAELCAQYWSTLSAPSNRSRSAQSLAKTLREEARAEITARVGEHETESTLRKYSEGSLPAPPPKPAPHPSAKPERPRHPRQVYIEQKTDGNRSLEHRGPAQLATVTGSRTGKTLYALGKTFERIKRGGIYGNYRCLQDGNEYWISGIKKRGTNRHRFGQGPITNLLPSPKP